MLKGTTNASAFTLCIVHVPRYLDGQRYQIIDIYYNGIAVIRGLSPEEMEKAFQKHLEQIKSKMA